MIVGLLELSLMITIAFIVSFLLEVFDIYFR